MKPPRILFAAVAVAAVITTTSGCSLISNLLPGSEPVRDESGQISETNDAADVFAIAVGDCLNDVSGTQVSTVPVVPCGEPHQYEAFAAMNLPDGDYPEVDEITKQADEFCYGEFESYVGISYDESALDFSYFYPQTDSWANGDREILCLAYGDEDLSGSVKDSKS